MFPSRRAVLACLGASGSVLMAAQAVAQTTTRATALAVAPTRSLKEIRERGVVMQKWENSCAAASLATVLTYGFADPVSERWVAQQMLKKTHPARVKAQGGFSLLDMKRLVDALGYTGNAYKHLQFEHLAVFHMPIVPINPHGFNHYVVFTGTQDDQVLLADPAFGRRSVRLDVFNAMWMTGMAFVITP